MFVPKWTLEKSGHIFVTCVDSFFNMFQLLSWTFPDLPGVSGTIRNAPKSFNYKEKQSKSDARPPSPGRPSGDFQDTLSGTPPGGRRGQQACLGASQAFFERISDTRFWPVLVLSGASVCACPLSDARSSPNVSCHEFFYRTVGL